MSESSLPPEVAQQARDFSQSKPVDFQAQQKASWLNQAREKGMKEHNAPFEQEDAEKKALEEARAKRVPSHEGASAVTPDPREFTNADQARLDQNTAMGKRWSERDDILPNKEKEHELAKHAADKITGERYKTQWERKIAARIDRLDLNLPPAKVVDKLEPLMNFFEPELTTNVMSVIYEKAKEGDEQAKVAAIKALGEFARQHFDLVDREAEIKIGRENQNAARTYIRALAQENANPQIKETAITLLGDGFDVTDLSAGKHHKALVRKIYIVGNSTPDASVREAARKQLQRYIDKPRTINYAERGYDAIASVQDFAKGVVTKLSLQSSPPTFQAA